MHLGHDHDHHHHGATAGHNSNGRTAQWQTPHLPAGHKPPDAEHGEPDLDLVETAFLASFPAAPDPTSFLRLAGVPFSGRSADGRTFSLLRVEANQTTDIGMLTPRIGGAGHGYDPLPAKLVSRRATLNFVYFDGEKVARLSLAEAKALAAM